MPFRLPLLLCLCAAACAGECPEGPAWAIADVALLITPVSEGALAAGGREPLLIPVPCQDAELTTDFCLAAGEDGEEYDMQLVADVYRPQGDPPVFCREPLLKDPRSCGATADARQSGAVVVRWRVQDLRTGRLLGRTQCRCPQETVESSPLAGAQRPQPARSPPAVWRLIRAGQVVNLDAVVLQVNTPPTVP